MVGLDQRLKEEAARLYGWEISFTRGLSVLEGKIILVNGWLEEEGYKREELRIGVGRIELPRKRSYGLVCLGEGEREDGKEREERRYQPVAEVQPSRFEDGEGEVLDAVILHLKYGADGRLKLELPAEWIKEVKERHIELLRNDGRYKSFKEMPGVLQIYREGDEGDLGRICESFRIEAEN